MEYLECIDWPEHFFCEETVTYFSEVYVRSALIDAQLIELGLYEE